MTNSSLKSVALALCLAVSVYAQSSLANEPTDTADHLLQAGFRAVEPTAPFLPFTTTAPAHSLPWPVEFQDAAHVIGNTMPQFQPYDSTYWHGGCDLRVKAGADITAPVDGEIVAGHYSYVSNADGSMTKYFKAWPASGDPTYFEVSIISLGGTRYEFHHVDETRLSPSIQKLIEQRGRVTAGTLIGHAITWPDGVYHHVHYNVIAPNGVRINPEYVSPLLPDTTAPQIQARYAVTASGQTLDFANGQFLQAPAEFVIAASDKQGQNIYEHPPTWARLVFSSGLETSWDFKKTLTLNDGFSFPPLYDVYLKTLITPDGRTLETTGGYGVGVSLVRLKVPTGAYGTFRIDVGDQNDNVSSLTGKIGL